MNEAPARTIVYSSVMGLIPCQVVGRNEGNYLVRALGAVMHVPRELVFELAPGFDLVEGQIVGPDGPAPLATCPVSQSETVTGQQEGR